MGERTQDRRPHLADAVRFYAVNRTDLMPSKTMGQVAGEFVESLQAKGVSSQYSSFASLHLKSVTSKLSGPIVRYESPPPKRIICNFAELLTATTAARLAFLRRAWLAIDAAVASLAEIRFAAREREVRLLP